MVLKLNCKLIIGFYSLIVSSRYLFQPFGIYLGLKAKPHRPPSTNTVLEESYKRSLETKQKITDADVSRLAGELGMTTRQIERWLRRRRVVDRPTILDKFAETRWTAESQSRIDSLVPAD